MTTLRTLHLVEFRAFAAARFDPHPAGTTVITGPNGAGKTTLLEALAYLGTLRSFRGAPREALVRSGEDRAVVRAELERSDGTTELVEAEIAREGRSRIQLNRQPARDRRQLADAVPVTVFSPEDLSLIQGGPVHRRDLLDDALRLLDRRAAATIDDTERILRQRAALLRQAGGALRPDIAASLDVWDERLAVAGEALAVARHALVDELQPLVAASYAALAGAAANDRHPRPGAGAPAVELEYRPSWSGSLHQALERARREDVRRAVTTVGPHRDDVTVTLSGRDARTQASQGEQRSLSLSLRLGVHALATARRGSPPVLLLDDVFSELDQQRSRALLERLPAGQALVTTAAPLPGEVAVDLLLDVRRVGGG